MKAQKHPFSFTLGPGPYKFVGFGEIKTSEVFGAKYVGPQVDSGAGTCAHCGHGIMNIYIVQTSDGKTHGVGSDCIRKLNCEDDSLLMSKVERAERLRKREQGRARRESQRRNFYLENSELIKIHQERFSKIKNPTGGGWTFLQYVSFYNKSHRSLGSLKNLNIKIKTMLSEDISK